MHRKLFLLFSLFLVLIILKPITTNAQQHQICDINWSSHSQNMWGPGWNPIILDFDYDLINLNFVQNIPIVNMLSRTCLPWPLNNVCVCIGYTLDLQLFLIFRTTFSMHGFTTGHIDVDYPVRIDLTFPADYSFNHGSMVNVNSTYTVLPGRNLVTHFPSLGVISLDVFFAFGVMMPQVIYTGSCNNPNRTDLIEDFVGFPLHIGTPSVPITQNIFLLNSQNGQYNFPCFTGGYPHFCSGQLLPITFNNLGGSGLSGFITLPYVVTHSWYDPATHCLYARGDSTWLGMELDIIQFIGWIANFIPGGQVIGQIIGYLNGSFSMNLGIGSVTVSWNLLQVGIGMNSTTTQDFSFCPDITTTLNFPLPVEYNEQPAGGGAIIAQGVSNAVSFHTGNDLNFRYPCYGWPSMDISTIHDLDNDFSNHTWDSISFYFYLRAFRFNINISIPPFINMNVPIGWLINLNMPIGFIPLTWYDNTWEFPGFAPYNCGTVTIIPNPEMTVDLTSDIILCAGSNSASVITTVEWGTPPFTYDYTGPTSASHNTTSRVDSLTNLGPGWYYVLVTDVNGCQQNDSTFIEEMFPPLAISHTSVNVTCVRGNDGQATVFVTGGAPGYTYLWTPSMQTNAHADSLYEGWQYATVTDSVGCIIVDSVYLTALHQRPPINVAMSPLEGCSPIDVNFTELNPSDSVQSYLWEFGDNSMMSGQNVSHTYINSDLVDRTYDVTLTVVSIFGCDSIKTFTDTITLYPLPRAEFTLNPIVTTIIEPDIRFSNESLLNDNNLWSFGDGTYSVDVNPVHEYRDTGKFEVTLYVQTHHGCRDTATYCCVVIKDIYTFYIPNAFTPNDDGTNDYFLPIGRNMSNDDFEFLIFDRWGSVVFESDNKDKGWDGTVNGSLPVTNSIYVWRIVYRDTQHKQYIKTGRVLLYLLP